MKGDKRKLLCLLSVKWRKLHKIECFIQGHRRSLSFVLLPDSDLIIFFPSTCVYNTVCNCII